MDTVVADKPNLQVEAVPAENASSGFGAIAEKMAAMKAQTLRNQLQAAKPAGTGSEDSADDSAPVAPEGLEIDQPEDAALEAADAEALDEADALEEVTPANSEAADIIDFLEFAETHPTARFKFVRNGKTIEIDARKAASILGQGAAISEDARQLKIERSEFDEYLNNKRAETEGLLLAMEFTVRPQLQQAYDEIIKTQNYQTVFQQQLAQTSDPAARTRIQANMEQNERYIAQQGALINQLKPNLDQFYQIRQQQVAGVLENNRRNFKDSELRNQYVYNEIRDKIAKDWAGAEGQLVPGIKNIDLVSSDEHLMSLLRDGLKFRDRPRAKSAGSSIAALTKGRGGSLPSGAADDISNLRQKAREGDRKAQDNLLVAQMNALRAQRGRR